MAGARPTHEACAHGASSIYGYQTDATWAFIGEPSAHGASSICGHQTDATRVFPGTTVQMELAPYNAARAEATQPPHPHTWHRPARLCGRRLNGSVDRRGAYAVAAECNPVEHPVEYPGKGFAVILSA